ncbi:hypothetical protein CEY16_03010 [Halalkalibacillus sediminis]|uniref:AMP-binding enzyme C-terminal domain-containing protein n=1 Tax=Halalkalibacillus sediminis TaxID=2018042 RepID=A0A2I0QWN1_9BACI|nr:hypothetical protein [Halalkalibacillus sediminis]PKR78742.1 hypothetical protein CEY16_03010 [Halalkalibacillus sediminis]
MMQQYGNEVDPYQLELLLSQHSKIKEAKVVNIPDPQSGEIIIAWVIRESSDLSEAEVLHYCREEVSSSEVPQAVYFTEEFPMTASGKIQKVKLRDDAIKRYSK